MKLPIARVLPFVLQQDAAEGPRVGRVHRDGSITFRGQTYTTIRDLPSDCLAMRPDQETYKEWKRLYRAIDPHRNENRLGTGGESGTGRRHRFNRGCLRDLD